MGCGIVNRMPLWEPFVIYVFAFSYSTIGRFFMPLGQGNSLKGIGNKTVKKQGF